MSRDSFDPPWEQTDVVMVDRATLEKAQRQLAGCESCTSDAEIPFDWLLDQMTGRDPRTTDYLLESATTCLQCGAEIREKTLVDLTEE